MKNSVIISAGDAITAKLVEQAGFDGIWVSGFEASARLGLADNGSITLTEMLNVAKPIVDAVSIPVWVDTDTGYGNFQRTVTEFEKIGVDGVSIEDNIPEQKTNSLWGEKIPLLNEAEFCTKIDVKRKNIKIIARTEALIRGYGKDEAIKRLGNYMKAGADILLPHARRHEDIINMRFRIPQAIVPTKFPWVTNSHLFSMGFNMVIWANQTERVKIKSIREALQSLKENDCVKEIEENLSATLDDMKDLTPDV